jgi:hypothetical protein
MFRQCKLLDIENNKPIFFFFHVAIAGEDPVPEQENMRAIGNPGQVLLTKHLRKTTIALDALQVSLVRLRSGLPPRGGLA